MVSTRFDAGFGPLQRPEEASPAVRVLQISDMARDCWESFSQLLGRLGTKVPVTQRPVTELRNSPEVKSLVVQQLHIAKRNLNAAKNRSSEAVELVGTKDGGVDQVAHLVEEDNVLQLSPALKATFAGIEGALDRLHRLGAAIRQASAGQLMSRIKPFASDERLNYFEMLAYSVLETLYPAANPNLLEHICKSLVEKYQKVLYLEARKRQYQLADNVPRGPLPWSPKLRAPLKPPRVQNGDEPSHHLLPSVRSSAFSEGEFNRGYQQTSRPSDSPRRPTASIGTSLAVYTPPQILPDNAKYADCQWCFKNYPTEMFNAPATWKRTRKKIGSPMFACRRTVLTSPSRALYGLLTGENTWKHNIRWTGPARSTSRRLWVCNLDVDPETGQRKTSRFTSEADLLEHLQEMHQKYTPRQQQMMARHSIISLSRDADTCPLCCFSVDEDKLPSKPETGVDRAVGIVEEDVEEDGHCPDMSAEKALQASRRMAKHVADHLHTFTFLIIRLLSLPLRDDDDDDEDQNTVSINPIEAETSDVADSDYQDLFPEEDETQPPAQVGDVHLDKKQTFPTTAYRAIR
ncbi:hypothetical protein ACQKWADRAFT_327919 [Trichoderma austrokoningii]